MVAAAIVVSCAIVQLTCTWRALNRAEAAEELLLVQRKVERTLMRLGQESASAKVWDQAYLDVADGGDQGGMRDKLAAYYRASFSHDITLLFHSGGALQYASRNGRRSPVGQEAGLAEALAPIVRDVQAEELAQSAGPSSVPRAVIVAADGRAYFLGVATFQRGHEKPHRQRTTTVVVTGRELKPILLQEIADNVDIDHLRFAPGAPVERREGLLPLVAPDGRPVGSLIWRVKRPGAEVIGDLAGPLSIAALVTGLVFALLVTRIGLLLRELDDQEAALEQGFADLTVARDDAHAASVAKSEFIANISHEIRTPLNGVLGMAEVLSQEELTPQQKDRVEVILQSGSSLLSILNSVLDLSKIEANRMEIAEAPFALEPMLRDVCRTYEARACEKGLRLEFRAGGAAGDWMGDEGRIRQILLNLVANAVKFTGSGCVSVTADATDNGIVVDVKDEGVGIPAEKIPLLFDAFSQVDNSQTRRFGGTGLGLAISRRLARLMGGDLGVESTEGVGSTFRLRLPLRRTTPIGIKTPSRARVPLAGALLRILAADDNPTNRLVMEALLAPLEAQVLLAQDGAEALALYESHEFDVILMDIQMPVMDGRAAVRAIREMEGAQARRRTPILAITANALHHQVEAYLADGMDGHVAKPLSADALYKAIADVVVAPMRCDTADIREAHL